MSDQPNSAINGIRAAYVLLGLGYVAVAIKYSAKIFKDARRWCWHDTFTLLALIFSTAEVIVSGINTEHYGFGRHVASFNPRVMADLIKLDVTYRMIPQAYVLYNLALMFVKLSILSFYRDIFRTKKSFRLLCNGMMVFVICYLTAFVLTATFRCLPVRVMWHPVLEKASYCINGDKEQTALASLNVVTDFFILLMPFPLLLRLNIRGVRLMSVCAVFALGLFTCAAAITRLVMTALTLSSSWSDGTWVAGPTNTWMNVELLVGQICAALLSWPAFFTRVRERTAFGQSVTSLISKISNKSSFFSSHDDNSDANTKVVRGDSSGSESMEEQKIGMPFDGKTYTARVTSQYTPRS